jgi:aspartate/methionine/tyrosine aminotransferase
MIDASIRCQTRPASGIREMGAMAASYENVLHLGLGEPDFNISPAVAEALKKAVDAGKNKYAPTPGIPELRAAIARKLKRENSPISYMHSSSPHSCYMHCPFYPP